MKVSSVALSIGAAFVSAATALGEDGLAVPSLLLQSASDAYDRSREDGDTDSDDEVANVSYQEPEYQVTGAVLGPSCAADYTYEWENATVILAISDCVNESALATIENWITETIWTYYGDQNVSFSTVEIPGGCQATDEPSTYVKPLDVMLLSQGSKLARFAKFGKVFEDVGELESVEVTPNVPIMLSFVTDESSYSEVQALEAAYQFHRTFTFQVCEPSTGCKYQLSNCVQLETEADLFSYNPVAISRRFSCDTVLPGGLPIVYLDESNERQCYCGCPAGYQEVGNACVPNAPANCTCEWDKRNGYRKKIWCLDEANTCKFSGIASSWKVPVPFPTDGYVADDRDNLNEGKNPRVELVVTKLSDPVYNHKDIASHFTGQRWPRTAAEIPSEYALSPAVQAKEALEVVNGTYTWKQFQTQGEDLIDELVFDGFGKYQLSLDAFDYYNDAKCPGCLAIVDHVRPTHTTQCPASFCDKAVNSELCAADAEMTEDNMVKAQDLVKQFYSFGDEASNDNCHQSNRCDKQVFKLQNFFEKDGENQQSSNAPTYEDGRTCFDRIEALDAFLQNNKAKENPLVNENGECRHSEDNPVQPGQCKRCCGYQTELRELWTDYKCGYDYDTRMCSGDRDEKCSFKQCLIFNGDSVATASANIKASVVAESEKVLEHIDQKTFQTVTQIHRVVDCTSFDSDTAGACNYEAKVSDLIEANAELKLDMGLYANVDDFVFWRYRVRGKDEKWQLWKNSAVTDEILTFDRAETMITIEAWTQCGKVRTFYFYVHLHLNSEIKVCDHFSQMWYQSTISLLKADDTICAYPGSDFAELTFDYHANIGLQYMRDRLNMNISRVTCTGSLDGRNSTTILDIERENADIVKRFGVELVNRETTEAITLFKVECTFGYKGHDNGSTHQMCLRSFNIKDCVGPDYDEDDHHCEYKGCAGSQNPGLYEACAGEIIRASPDKTYRHFADGDCCQGCTHGQPVKCVSLLNLPNAKEDLKRCEPAEGVEGGYASDDSVANDNYDSDDDGEVAVSRYLSE